MDLELKLEYYDFSIGGGKKKKIKLKDICPSLYPDLYKSNLSDFFIVSEVNIPEEVEKSLKSKKKDIKADDTNKSTGE